MHAMHVALHEVSLYNCALLYAVHRTYAKTAAVSRGTSHVTTKPSCKCITSVDIQNVYAESYSFEITYERSSRAEKALLF